MECKHCGRCKISPEGKTRSLSELVPGEKCTILSINGEGPLRARILDMGLTKGAVVQVIKKAPLGDPLELKVRGYILSLRKHDASMIEVI